MSYFHIILSYGNTSETGVLSNLIGIFLEPLLLHVKSYVKDNLDFLSKCSRENYEDTLLVTFERGALDYWFENHPESLHARFNKEFVLEC